MGLGLLLLADGVKVVIFPSRDKGQTFLPNKTTIKTTEKNRLKKTSYASSLPLALTLRTGTTPLQLREKPNRGHKITKQNLCKPCLKCGSLPSCKIHFPYGPLRSLNPPCNTVYRRLYFSTGEPDFQKPSTAICNSLVFSNVFNRLKKKLLKMQGTVSIFFAQFAGEKKSIWETNPTDSDPSSHPRCEDPEDILGLRGARCASKQTKDVETKNWPPFQPYSPEVYLLALAMEIPILETIIFRWTMLSFGVESWKI